jgi:hypothetical protein
MKIFLNITALVVSSVVNSAFGQELPKLLSPEEAQSIVEDRRAKNDAAEKAYRREALGQAALAERSINKGGQKIRFRRVAAGERVEVADAIESKSVDLSMDSRFAEAAEYVHENISLGANVYGDEYSEITWRDPETGQTVTVWTNISLNYLKPIVSFTADDIHYDYFGFVMSYTREGDEARMKMAKELGYEAESQWKYPPVRLSADYHEYYVDAPWDAEIPEKLHRQLSALFAYYLKNEEKFKIEYLNSRTLQAAREANLKSNPPKEAKEVIMNYSPLRGEDAE